MKIHSMYRDRGRLFAGLGVSVVLVLGGAVGCSSDSGSEPSESALPTASLPVDKATGEPVKIGFINSDGGSLAPQPENEDTARAAVSYINESAGGINGRPIDLIVCKQQEDPASATKCANQMVEDKVAAVVIPGTAQGAAILPILAGAKIPYVGPTGVSAIDLTSPDSYMYTAGLPGVVAGMAAYSAQEGFGKISLLVGDGGGVPAQVQALGGPIFQAAGVELTVVPIPQGVPDPTPQVTAGLQGNPDAVAFLADAQLCISILKTLQTVSPDKERLIVPPCVSADVVTAVGSAPLEGAKNFTTVDVYSDDPDSVLYHSAMAKYAPDAEIGGYGYTGYQGVMGLYRVIENLTGDITPATVIEAFKTSKDVPLPIGGGLTFTCNGQAFPQLPSVCSKSVLVGTVTGDGRTMDLTSIG